MIINNGRDLMPRQPLSSEPVPLRSMKAALARAEARHGPDSAEAITCREVLERFIKSMPEPRAPTPDPPQEDFSERAIRDVLARTEAKHGENSKRTRVVREALESYKKSPPNKR